jgi:hypothetical protein
MDERKRTAWMFPVSEKIQRAKKYPVACLKKISGDRILLIT